MTIEVDVIDIHIPPLPSGAQAKLSSSYSESWPYGWRYRNLGLRGKWTVQTKLGYKVF